MSLYTEYIESLKLIVEEVMELFKFNIQKELVAQGHKLTGGLASDIDIEISQDGDNIQGRLLIRKYGIYIDRGIKADRIPYTRASRRGGTSKYIQGLIDFWQKRGLQTREAKRAAFATAQAHKREGMPTRNSYRFSRNNRRTGFLQASTDAAFPAMIELLENKGEQAMIIKIQSPIVELLLTA